MIEKLFGLRDKERVSRQYAVLIVAILVVVGLWLRVRNLGHLSLLADEGIEALAVKGVLEHGVPKVDSGLIYGRWPLYLYIQSALAWIFELNEFWLRLPSAIFGTLVILPAYVLGRDLFDRPVGLLVAAILTFSVWEIELSRYARGYTTFQFFFLTSLVCFYRGFMLDRSRYRVLFLVIAVFTLFTHALSDLLVVLFAIPLISPAFRWAKKLKFSGWGLGIAGMIMARKQLIGFQLPDHLTEVQTEPGGAVDQLTRALGVPSLNLPETKYFLQVLQEAPFLLGALALVAGIATVYLFYLSYTNREYIQAILALIVIWSSLFHQFGISFIFIFVYLISFSNANSLRKNRIFITATLSLILYIISWFCIFIIKFSHLHIVMIIKRFFDFPDLYDYMLDWLVGGWPVMTMFLVLGSLSLFYIHIKDPKKLEPIFLLGSLYSVALTASLFESFQVSRYFFHLYPLILIVFSWVIYKMVIFAMQRSSLSRKMASWIAIIVCLPVLMLASQDAYPSRAWSIGERTYQSEIDPYRGAVSWEFYAGFHQDLKSPSLYVREHATEQDTVIVLEPEHMAAIYSFYLDRVDYYLASKEKIHRDALIKKNSAEENKYIHYITGTEIVTKRSELRSIIDRKEGGVWIIADRRLLQKENPIYTSKIGLFMEGLKERGSIEYVGEDGIMCVLRLR